MRKALSLLFLLILYSGVFAQFDREHWFAPMVDRTGNPDQYQKLYLSTNRTAAFPVSIYNNNVLIATVSISKGNPQKIDIPRQYLITSLQADLFTPTTKGIYVKADFPFYANLRFSVFNHAEIVTSKGISSTGTLFYTAVAPITVANPLLNFMTSILATEDNTTVTISGYKSTVQFSNGMTGASNPTLTFTLNKGQSYIIEGSGTSTNNLDSFIGSKILSNKPINVTNGNFNGQYAGNHATSSDILMDQSVPVSKLGNIFVLVKGNGLIGDNMEGAIVIGTQNNTQIFLNDESVPAATINEGEYYIIPESKYVNQGNNHYNLYITTSNNAYVYQMLSGTDTSGNAVASGGFNFIPALNCYLPKQIDELGFINENQVHSNANPAGILNIPTKLNLITEAGAYVTVNGLVPPVTTGPFSMTGTSNWVTYGIPNISGNITVNSNKPITAGITAGTDAVGYGGFFAGFPTQPKVITTGGTCLPGAALSLDPLIYDTYQWYRNGAVISGATNSTYNPTLPGYYSASVTMGSCAPLTTEEFKFEKCMVNRASTYSTCTPVVIAPQFTSLTVPQGLDVSSVSITVQPTFGSISINPVTGEITYTPTTNVATTDTFTYTFCGNDPDFPECETVVVTVNILQIPVTNVTLDRCSVNGLGNFNLTNAMVTTQSPVTITYYPTLADAQNETATALITNVTNYSAPHGTIVYAVVKSPIGCKSIAEITLNLYPYAEISDFTGIYCDDDFDGFVKIDFTTITPQLLQNPSYFNVRYYATLANANAGNSNTLPMIWSYSSNSIVYVRAESPDGCSPVVKAIRFEVGTKFPINTSSTATSICDDDLDGIKDVNLNDFKSFYTSDPLVVTKFYTTMSDAQLDINQISNIVTVNIYQVYYIRFERAGTCPEVASIIVQIKEPKTSKLLQDVEICKNDLTTIDAGPGFDSYLWSTGEIGPAINVGLGTYWVELEFNGCSYRQTVTVSEIEGPTIDEIDIQNRNISVKVSGGTGTYEYSLDGDVWQLSNVFIGLPMGDYIMHVRDANKCEIITKKFIIFDLINAMSPNDDGLNDTIDYSSLMNKQNLKFKIYDRYGKQVFEGTKDNRFTWNGKYNGRLVSTATYWYTLEWLDGSSVTKYSSYLLVKNIR